jgi:hypothetical protein
MTQQPQDRLTYAKQYAEAAKQRNTPPCQCERCKQEELLPGVMQLVQRWRQ